MMQSLAFAYIRCYLRIYKTHGLFFGMVWHSAFEKYTQWVFISDQRRFFFGFGHYSPLGSGLLSCIIAAYFTLASRFVIA